MTHPALGILVLTEAMNNLKECGYCQHDISSMVPDAVDQYIKMEEDFAKEEGRKPFPIECDHDDKPSFLEALKHIPNNIN